MIAQVFSVLLMVAMTTSSPEGGYGVNSLVATHVGGHVAGFGQAGHTLGFGYGTNALEHGKYTPAKYDFAYGVSDPHYGANFGHSESRDGYNTKGQYYVNLPDGRLQKVTYYADQYGYHPTVTYEGKAHFPSYGKGYQ